MNPGLPWIGVRHLVAAAALTFVAPLVAGCHGDVAPPEGPSPPAPPYRAGGPRLPPISGVSPSLSGRERVDDLLWIEERHLDAWQKGLVFDGTSYRSRSDAAALPVPAESGFLLRTDHVTLRTNAAFPQAQTVARWAEDHVTRWMDLMGEALDLRLPSTPLPIVLVATRAEFQSRLKEFAGREVSWGAFYDAQTGRVEVCAEPAREGALPLQADLRHEMTHQILDLSRDESRRQRTFPPGWFWLWEGIAVYAETLGDGPEPRAEPIRRERFRARLQRRTHTPLRALLSLSQSRFEGRHYDQVAVLMPYLLDPAHSERRRRLLGTVRDLLAGKPPPTWGEALGTSVEALEGAWLLTLR